ncbi:hypothetical protein [Hyalangium minutum]|uniref:Uncharacterized protein n=1 Tax=Hyalangium minutum TaxID=394096 RepID=A0A085WEL3_9BACT|nr:hypothetical protein [Hyalangium minutum]KFE66126.1 hypothetical protein DB31_1191 [Hyalangium minutum]
MAISSLNRSSFSAPLSSPSALKPASAPARSLEGIPAQQPGSGLRQRMMMDSFEMGPRSSRKMGEALGASPAGGFEKSLQEMSQALNALLQQLKSLTGQQPMDQGATAGEAAKGVGGAAAPASSGAPAAPEQASAVSPSQSAATPAHPTYNSDAGPGFGPPSAGSTEPAPAGQPWLAKNNVGSPYNSNMQLIDPSQKGQFKYTNTFTNNTDKPQTITLWNKTGANGNPNDGQHFDKSAPKTFTLQPGQSQTVAFDTNSSVAWSASKDGTAKAGANYGQTWGEATFANSATGWSGYDVSQISPAGHNGNMSISNEATGATVTQANAWQTPSDDPAGKDVGVPAGPLNLKTVLS